MEHNHHSQQYETETPPPWNLATQKADHRLCVWLHCAQVESSSREKEQESRKIVAGEDNNPQKRNKVHLQKAESAMLIVTVFSVKCVWQILKKEFC